MSWMRWMENHDALLWWLAASSLITLAITAFVVKRWLVRVPADYFAHPRPQRAQRSGWQSVLNIFVQVGKNLLGYLLIVLGILMLTLPGQGVLTILVGAMLANFPGKYRVLRWLVGRPPVRRVINRLRRRAGQPALAPSRK